jgi:hypothetical protein
VLTLIVGHDFKKKKKKTKKKTGGTGVKSMSTCVSSSSLFEKAQVFKNTKELEKRR